MVLELLMGKSLHPAVPRFSLDNSDMANRAYFPPSIEIVCPLIQPARSEAKNNTP